ncbi:protein ImuB [Inhella inkyongensis]|uniref:Protein ImuB n=1 Tax=Inhella inkyongensis TaxID=392593 RepID=A0A840S4M3_9BURK|nr:DNA polymerase Y family protein [Inhella inkyongensis]MBB5203774.1 protein ImuB [Inhella inkyongensis]
MLWLALRCRGGACPEALLWWALQYTPRVARMEEALVLELSASLRLFGGKASLQQRLLSELQGLIGEAQASLAWASHSRAALLLARAAAPGELVESVPGTTVPQLEALPLRVLTSAQPQLGLLTGLGCRRLGDLRRLPRAALVRRVGPALLRELDAAFGQGAEAHDWVQAPEHFDIRCELPQRCDQAQALLQAAQPLLQTACLWLAARHAGAAELQLGWRFDVMRARDLGPGGEVRLAASAPHRRLRSWQRLLAEHLQRLSLPAPVSDLWLRIERTEPLAELSASLLLPDAQQDTEAQRGDGESLDELLARLSVRLGAANVRQARAVSDHRPEHQQQWQAWQAAPQPSPPQPRPEAPAQWPQPSWLLNPPQPLNALGDQPLYQGPLTLLAGPQRIEAGWWDGPPCRRDYYLAHGLRAGLLWIYRERSQGGAAPTWFLHGLFA